MLEKTEINTGRQYEFDYMKGLFTPMILLIHSFQILVGTGEHVGAYKIMYILATMTGSAIFMFVLGLGSTYSRRTNAQLVKDGAKLLLWQLTWNVLAMGAPLIISHGLRTLFGLKTAWDVTWELMPVMLQYINVFFIAGMCYFLLALLWQIKTPTWTYFAPSLVILFSHILTSSLPFCPKNRNPQKSPKNFPEIFPKRKPFLREYNIELK